MNITNELEVGFIGVMRDNFLPRTKEARLDRGAGTNRQVGHGKRDAAVEPHRVWPSLQRFLLEFGRSDRIPQGTAALPKPVMQGVRRVPAQVALD